MKDSKVKLGMVVKIKKSVIDFAGKVGVVKDYDVWFWLGQSYLIEFEDGSQNYFNANEFKQVKGLLGVQVMAVKVGAKVVFKEGLCGDAEFDGVIGEVVEIDPCGNLYLRFSNSDENTYADFECDADESELIFLSEDV